MKVYFLTQMLSNVFFPLSLCYTPYSHICGPLLNLFRTSFICLNQWFSTGVIFGPQGTSGNYRWHSWLSQLAGGGRMLLASGRWKIKTPISIQQCAGQPQTSKDYPAQNVNSAGNPNQIQRPVKIRRESVNFEPSYSRVSFLDVPISFFF